MSKPERKCSLCSKAEDDPDIERFHFFELVWKCDLILNKKLWQGILCEECHEAFFQRIEKIIES